VCYDALWNSLAGNIFILDVKTFLTFFNSISYDFRDVPVPGRAELSSWVLLIIPSRWHHYILLRSCKTRSTNLIMGMMLIKMNLNSHKVRPIELMCTKEAIKVHFWTSQYYNLTVATLKTIIFSRKWEHEANEFAKVLTTQCEKVLKGILLNGNGSARWYEPSTSQCLHITLNFLIKLVVSAMH